MSGWVWGGAALFSRTTRIRYCSPEMGREVAFKRLYLWITQENLAVLTKLAPRSLPTISKIKSITTKNLALIVNYTVT